MSSSSSDEESGRKKRPVAKRNKKEEKSDFEEKLETAREKCPGSTMKIANIVAACFIGIGILVRFSYLIGAFTFWGLLECLFMVIFGLILFASYGALGPGNSDSCRTYFNFLDNNFGQGSYMVFLCVVILQKADKGE